MLQFTGSIILFVLVASVHSVTRPPGIFVNPAKEKFFKPLETVDLPCVAEGEPTPSYAWKRNKIDFNPSGNDARITQLPGSGTLVFNSPEEKDEGIYQCFAKNDFGESMSLMCNLRVARLDEFPLEDAVYHKPQVGQSFTLPCTPPTSAPDPEVIWIIMSELGGFDAVNYDDRVSMDREYRLRFNNIVEGDGQNGQPYACMAMNSIMRSNVQSHLHYLEVEGSGNFQVVRKLWADPFDLVAVRGQNFSMQCIFSGNPTPEVQWERGGNKSMPASSQLLNYAQVLVIENIQPEDAGSYKCWATNEVSGGQRAQSDFQVRVDSSPVFIKEPEDVEIGVGGNVEFGCSASGKPEPKVQWFINGLNLTDPSQKVKHFQKPTLNTLFFANVTENDHMVIQCNASNERGYVFADVFLNVLSEAPDFLEPPAPRVVSAEGLEVNLSCRTTGKPDPIITWFKDGVQVSGGRFQILKDGTLHIEGVVLADASLYRCRAQNVYGEVSGEGTLVVRRKTRIEQKPGDLERNAGMDAKFTCSATTDPEEAEKLRTYWLKDGDEILADDQRTTTNYQDNSLTISGTIVRDSGTYTCVATNGLDNAKASAVLTVRDKPDPPLEVFQRDCNKNVTIEWMPGSLNNAPLQYYILQYNTSFNPNQWTFGMKVNGTWTKVSFELSPWVNYNFRIIAYNKIGPSNPSAHTPRVCTTKPDMPSYHPKGLRTIGHEKNRLYIEWISVPQIQHNAPGFFYLLTFYRVGDSSSQPEQKTITNWTTYFYEHETGFAYTRYEITIASINSIGEAKGDPSKFAGRSFEDTPTISPTDFEVAEEGTTYAAFTWQFPKSEIDKVENSKIKGEFMGFKITFWEEGNKINTVRDFDVGPESAHNSTGNTFSSRVENVIPNTRMMGHISVKNNYYIGAPSETIRFTTKPGLPGPVDYFRVLNIGDTHVNLEWGSPLENRGDLEGYDISYQLVSGLELGEMQDREPQINDAYTANGILSGLEPKRKYRIYIYARTSKGRGEGYFIEIVTTKPVAPEIPHFTIPNVGSTYINVSWWVNAYLKSGSIIFVEYRKLDGAEWLRTADEVVNTWQNISNLESGTWYEVRIKATNGFISIPSSIEEVETDGDAEGYDLVENIGWFIGVLLAELLIIALIILFFLMYKNGMRLTRLGYSEGHTRNSGEAYSGTYNEEHINKGPDPKGYNNDYYDDRDYDDQGFNKPPSYTSQTAYGGKGNDKASAQDYEDYAPNAPAGDYEDQDYPDDRGYYDRRDDDYYNRGGGDGYDYDNRQYADNYNYDRDGYDRDGYYDQDQHRVDGGYDYDSEDTGRHSGSKGGNGKAASSTFV